MYDLAVHIGGIMFWRKDDKKVIETSELTSIERKELIEKLEKLKVKLDRKIRLVPKKKYQ